MPSVDTLNRRLDQIAQALNESNQGLALLGLGSAGIERARMDEFSDLDFFAIVRPGQKQRFIEDLFWLRQAAPLVYAFRNTHDGYKALYEDGVFCEFAVFEPQELANIPFAPGLMVWHHPDFDTSVIEPKSQTGHYQRSEDRDWQVGEAITNLYVGLCRYLRGEKLSAMRFVQQFALDRVLDLIHLDQKESGLDPVDRYMPDRRIESRFEQIEPVLSQFCQGYERTPESAANMLAWLERHYVVESAMAEEIRRLIGQA